MRESNLKQAENHTREEDQENRNRRETRGAINI